MDMQNIQSSRTSCDLDFKIMTQGKDGTVLNKTFICYHRTNMNTLYALTCKSKTVALMARTNEQTIKR